ncbi:hypothetical protein B0T16DRAFT_246830 [Cercophora newfieldiana]|uniref:Uncharacterized protein n=1 Tax=Cercophora newfieldiana TaxID=92897 RepID=A0AA40CI31_9PEZI|nr:hypothetical protein B0T16DRAFT_246830 [Cercophora newfieldiana]
MPLAVNHDRNSRNRWRRLWSFNRSLQQSRNPTSSPRPSLRVNNSSNTGTAATVDIVTFHGCDGDYRNWVFSRSGGSGESANGVNWLTGPDGIAKGVPNARILLFTYDINVQDGHELIHRVVYGNALLFLQALSSLRKHSGSQGRPIIFIAHSLGGLILKTALASCSGPAAAQFGDICKSTLAVHLFGTPSSGSSPHAFHAALDNMFSLICNSRNPSGGLEKNARNPPSRQDSSWLEGILQSFKALMAVIAVFSYYESLETLDVGMIVNRQPSFSSIHSRDSETSTGSCRITLPRDHMGLMRFEGPGHWTYLQLLRSLRDFNNSQRSRSTTLPAKNAANADLNFRALDKPVNLALLSNIPVDQGPENLEPQDAPFHSLVSSRPLSTAGFPVVVFWGEGAVGNPAIARSLRMARTKAPDAFMYRFRAETRETIMADYLTLFRSIHRQDGSSMNDCFGATCLHDILNAESIHDLDDMRMNSVLKYVREWLLDPKKEEWLLVFENVVDPDGIYDMLPLRTSGRIVLTTRRDDTLHLGERREVLSSRSQPIPRPLKLDQWLDHEVAGPVLKIAASLSADIIPLGLFHENPEDSAPSAALELIDGWGLVDITVHTPTKSIRLRDDVRDWIRTRLADSNDTAKWGLLACTLCARFYQAEDESLPAQERQRIIAPHAQSCYQSIKHVPLDELPTDVEWSQLGELCRTHAAYDEAIGYVKISLWQRQRASKDPLSEDWIQAVLCLSASLCRLGNLRESAKHLETLAFDKMIEQSALWSLVIKTELAKAKLDMIQGLLESAEQILQRLLGFLDNLEDEPAKQPLFEYYRAHVTRHLAHVLEKQKKMEAARAFYQRTFIALENLLGPRNPSTIETGEEWVNILQAQGQYGLAMDLTNRFLSLKKKVLGARHPSTAGSMVKKAELLGEVGDFGKAARLYDDGLEIMTSTLGYYHPRVLRTMGSKAASLAAHERYDDALEVIGHVIQQMKSTPLWYSEEDAAWAVAKQYEFTEQQSRKGFDEALERSLV